MLYVMWAVAHGIPAREWPTDPSSGPEIISEIVEWSKRQWWIGYYNTPPTNFLDFKPTLPKAPPTGGPSHDVIGEGWSTNCRGAFVDGKLNPTSTSPVATRRRDDVGEMSSTSCRRPFGGDPPNTTNCRRPNADDRPPPPTRGRVRSFWRLFVG
jgi:hypothetical protein